MNILVLGGTVFLGRHIVERARKCGHVVTLFNRGQRNVGLFHDVEKLRGDRNGDLSAIRDRRFDAVIDCSGYTATHMRSVASALGAHVSHYVFVSSVSAYVMPPPNTAYDETTPLLSGDEGYGAQKARAEEAICRAYPERVAIVRPGLIVGPHDPTGRFVYWPLRVARGGNALAPGRPSRAVQWIDVRDLAAWIVRIAEQRITGTFNAVTPARSHSMQSLLEACARAAGTTPQFHWVNDADLAANEVTPWTELPLWIPEADEASALMLAQSEKAIRHGLEFSSVDDTVNTTFQWAQSLAPTDDNLGLHKTLSQTREHTLLKFIGAI